MGLFSFIGRAVGKVTGAIAKGAGKAIEKLGDITNSGTLWNIGWSMQDAGDRLAGNIGRSSSYDSSAPDLQQTFDLNKEFAEYAKEIGDKSDELEQKILVSIRGTFDELNRQAEDEELSMDINTLKREQNECINNMKGVLKNHISKRVSLDDRDCLKIMEMQPGPNKEYEMKRFRDKVFIEGKVNLQKAVDTSVRKMYSDFWENFDGMMSEAESSVAKTKDVLSRISQKDNTATREYATMEAESVILGTKLVEHIIGA